ncbi:major facilitator MFS-1 [Hysterangium stoloniferum]|nr:major facilitator MFS-1 [Hysterangium stoloniferum]
MASLTPPRSISIPPGNRLDDSAVEVTPNSQPLGPIRPPALRHDSTGRVSFSQPFQRPAGLGVPITRTFTGGTSGVRSLRDIEHVTSPPPERPPIPSALAASGPQGVYSTPLPKLPMIVLSITMLGEFLSANVCTPFLLFMVEGFLKDRPEADVGSWTGILVSTFFLSQFLTSLLWATVADQHGQRAVLFVSLLGSGLTCLAFGTSRTLNEALAIRLLQGVFAGSMGVARSSVTNITDGSNEGRAYAILGFSWGLGGVAGAIVGGTFESPVKKWPGIFSKFPIFVSLPYLLPCMIAASVTCTGALLSLFLARDGGSRGGAIRLPTGKELTDAISEEADIDHPERQDNDRPTPSTPINQLRKKISNSFSGLFAKRTAEAQERAINDHVRLSSPIPVPQRNSRNTSSIRTSRANGSAYGYSRGRDRLLSNTFSLRRGSVTSTVQRRRGTPNYDEDGAQEHITPSHEPTNFAQRLVMANEMAVTNIADLWVAAAINADNDEVFMSDEDAEFSDDDLEIGRANATPENPLEFGRTLTVDSAGPGNPLEMPRTFTYESGVSRGSRSYGTPSRARLGALELPYTPRLRPRISRGFSAASSQLPSIYSNAGVRAPPGVVEEISVPMQSTLRTEDPFIEELGTIPERSQQPSEVSIVVEKPPSAFKQLPFMIILQYGLLALHSTTHDQVFLSYLVSKYDAGGLGLDAGNFAQLIALMSLAQIVYQFYFYPNIGPPRGRFSHLAMFRIGSLLFIPAYISVTLFRVFASADGGNFFLMTLLAISTAVRYCGSTFGYTSIAILLNYVSPPHVVGLANGMAQSIVSLARFVGPVLGGYLWSVSIQEHPSGYPLGFFVCAGVCSLAIMHSFFIR